MPFVCICCVQFYGWHLTYQKGKMERYLVARFTWEVIKEENEIWFYFSFTFIYSFLGFYQNAMSHVSLLFGLGTRSTLLVDHSNLHTSTFWEFSRAFLFFTLFTSHPILMENINGGVFSLKIKFDRANRLPFFN